MPPAIGPRVWFHVASLGEFEQARPVIESLKSACPEADIVLTFYSPSGYRMRKDYPHARVSYLPADLPGHARRWLEAVKPDIAVFVKYDLWPGYIRALVRRRVPAILISAHWNANDRFSSWANPLVKPWLRRFDKIFLQRPAGLEALRKAGFENLAVAGDTRIDRALELPGESHVHLGARWEAAGPFVLVAGSTWPPDESILFEVTREMPGRFLIAPHDVREENIRRIESTVPGPSQRWSTFEPGHPFKYLILDGIGLLAYAYELGDLAYVGGGFGEGIHNTLEPMAHGRPVLFGPRFHQFPEAVDAVAAGAAFPVSDPRSLEAVLRQLAAPDVRRTAGERASSLLESHRGATRVITAYLLESLPCRPS